LFFQSDEVCETSSADRKGKYQAQQGIVLPKLYGESHQLSAVSLQLGCG
jgi:hypothetical protein